MYATLISGIHSTLPRILLNPQDCRDKFLDLSIRVSKLLNEDISTFLRELRSLFFTRVQLISLSDAIHMRNLTEMLSVLSQIGAPAAAYDKETLGMSSTFLPLYSGNL